MLLPLKLTLDMMQNKWKSILDPLISNPITQGHLIDNISFVGSGNVVVNHKLGRKQIGWIITDYTGSSSGVISRTLPFNDLTLTLTATNDCVVSLWVF